MLRTEIVTVAGGRRKPHWRQREWCHSGLWEKGAERGFEVAGHLSQEAAASATLGRTGWASEISLEAAGGRPSPSGEGWPGVSVVSGAGSTVGLGTRPLAPLPSPKPRVPTEKSRVRSVSRFLICQIDFLEISQARVPCGTNETALDKMP